MRLVAVFLVLFASVPDANEPFEFKGFRLGMDRPSLEQVIAKKIWVAKKQGAFKKPVKWEVPLPLCSDDSYRVDETPRALVSGDVVCVPGWPALNPEMYTVAGEKAFHIELHLTSGKLWKIELVFDSRSFETINKAFSAKFGEPSSTTTEEFQNGFGAKFTGQLKTWHRGPQSILLREGGHAPDQPGNGQILIFDDVAAKKLEVPPKIDF
jgi:hypothetical protein